MANKIPALLLLLLFGLCPGGDAQYDNRLYHTRSTISPADSQQLFFRFENATFLNNKEFFNPYQPGYTLIGFFLRPALEFYPGPDTRLVAGAHLLKYSGDGKYSQAIPVFTFHHRFAPWLEMVAGSIYGALNHGLIEPLFSFERVFTHHNESGFQFLLNHDFFKADIWLNWEKFIFAGDPFKEEFTAGFSSTLYPAGRGSPFRVEVPVQLLVSHRGGQIDVSDERMQNIVNYATGIHAEWNTNHSFIRSAGFRGYLAGFRDLSSSLENHYDKGWGIYPNIIIGTRWGEAGVGYWKGHKFVAPRGEPVFQSVSRVDPLLAVDRRELLTSKIIFNRKLIRGINMAVRFEVYYDPPAGQFDHTGGLHIVVNERLFVTRVTRR
jgi:hypothetical protein